MSTVKENLKETLGEIWDCITYFFKGALLLQSKFSDALVYRVFFVMQAYLTNGWRISFTRAAAIMNFWEGSTLVLPALFQFLADEVLGNFTVAIVSTIFSSLGIGMVALSVPSILNHYGGRCPKPEAYSCLDTSEEALFFTGMVVAAVGRAGTSFSIDALRDEQHPEESGSPIVRSVIEAVKSYINCGFSVDKLAIHLLGSLLIFIFVAWVKNWKLLFGIPAIYNAFLTVVFLCGCYWLKHTGSKGSPLTSKGSPLTSVGKVLWTAAASKNRSEPLISDEDDRKPFFDRFPRCLNRAIPTFDKKSVEIARFIIGMIPISMTFIVCGVVSSIGNTYFVEQANHMNRRIGSWNVPILTLQLAVSWFKLSHTLYMWGLFKIKKRIQKWTRIDFSIIGIAMAMTYSVLCCITAAIMEEKRLRMVRSHEVPMHFAWLLFQFLLLAGLDACLRKSVKEFYTDRAPKEVKAKLEKGDEAAKRYLSVAVDFVCGLGFLCSVLSVYVSLKFSNWFQYTLNESRLDRYYWWLAGVSAVNCVLYLVLVVFGYVRWPPEETQSQET